MGLIYMKGLVFFLLRMLCLICMKRTRKSCLVWMVVELSYNEDKYYLVSIRIYQ